MQSAENVRAATLKSRRIWPALLLAALGLLGACAHHRPHYDAAVLRAYQAAAGEPVKSFRFLSLLNWRPLDREHLVVWTGPSTAWLIAIRANCTALVFSQRIALTSSLDRVYSFFDKVIQGPYECRIREIRPVDLKRLRDGVPALRERGLITARGR
ncbi:MAG: DUF6491 family protein [Lysobacterales bacterium]